MSPRRRTSWALRVATAALVVPLLACSQSADGGPDEPGETSTATVTTDPVVVTSSAEPDESAGVTSSAAPRVARIGVLTSLTGRHSAAGRGVRNSVELAVREANADGSVPGWRFEVVAVDDRGSQSAGQRVASMLAGTGGLVGVVGSLHPAVDEGVQPILNNAGVPMLAPAATAGQLTQRASANGAVRPFPTYFRLAPREDAEGVAAARFAVDDLAVARVAVVDDGSAYGRMVVEDFVAALPAGAVDVVSQQTLDPLPSAAPDADGGDPPVTELLDEQAAEPDAEQQVLDVTRSIAAADDDAGVDLVFVGGDVAAAARLASALHEQGVAAPLLGGDEIFAPRFASPSGGARPGDLAMFAGTPGTGKLGDAYAEAYAAADFAEPAGVYGAAGYDAAQLLIEAFGEVVGDDVVVGPATRREVVATIDEIELRGATGSLSFDEFGDRERVTLTPYLVSMDAWRPVGSVRVG